MTLSGAAPCFISWVTSQSNFGSCGLQLAVVYVLNKTDWAQQSNVCKPSFSLDYFHLNVERSDSRCRGSGDCDILLHRITFTKIGNTTLRMIFIVSYIYDHLISWLHLFKHSWEKIEPRAQRTELSCMWSYSYIMNARNEINVNPDSPLPSFSFAVSCCSVLLFLFFVRLVGFLYFCLSRLDYRPQKEKTAEATKASASLITNWFKVIQLAANLFKNFTMWFTWCQRKSIFCVKTGHKF